MFGGVRIKAAKPTPKRSPSKSRFMLIQLFVDRVYRNPYNWGLFKGLSFFAAGIYVAKVLCEMDILPADPPSSAPATPAMA